MRIIAADDETIALEQLMDAIRQVAPDAELVSFKSPTELLKYAEGKTYDVAFLDIEMGSLSGVDVARQLKLWNPRINIIFVTAYDKYMAQAFKMHASGYVFKPISVDDIRAGYLLPDGQGAAVSHRPGRIRHHGGGADRREVQPGAQLLYRQRDPGGTGPGERLRLHLRRLLRAGAGGDHLSIGSAAENL